MPKHVLKERETEVDEDRLEQAAEEATEQVFEEAVSTATGKSTSMYDFDVEKIAALPDVPIHSKSRSGGKESLSISVVNTSRNGARVTLTNKLIDVLGLQGEAQFGIIDDDRLVIGRLVPNAEKGYPFSTGVGTNIIYRRELVDILSEAFELDYTSKSSLSFNKINIVTKEINGEEHRLAIVTMK
jgi:hypothetical protein